MFYFFRCSAEIPKEYGGKWSRAFGIPDDKVYIHKSAATPSRPEGTVVSAPGGWFDAGDYNLYTVNAGITTFTLMALYEAFQDKIDQFKVKIPESGNGVPDILNEVAWELKWLEQMQDPESGAVYHKLSALRFTGGMPAQYNKKRYMIGISTSAALNFAATLAQASRIYKNYEKQFPGSAERYLKKAKLAYEWAKKNPYKRYEQDKEAPDCITGIYQDENCSDADEFSWAATELYITTKDDQYYKESYIPGKEVRTPVWTNVSALPYISLINNLDNLTSIADKTAIVKRLTEYVDYKVFDAYKATGVAYRMANKRYEWGSNGFVSNIGMLAIMAYKATGEKQYFDLAVSHMDYLLGKNPNNKSFVSSFGSNPPMNIHQRLCMNDGVKDPIPGILVGGPNPWEVVWDMGPLAYKSQLPALSYADDNRSFSTNEAAINWNAPLTFLSGAIYLIKKN
jgi:endoglucanase